MMRSIKSLPISQLLALSCIIAVTGVDGKVVVGTTRNEESNGTVSVVDIEDHNKTQYFNQNFQEGNYNYGYDIRPSGPNGQFHHENKAADGVVYGCYGYLDPNNQAQITFYISDAWGYRPVRQEQPVEVFFPAQNPEGTTDMKGDTIQWAELIFPEKCTYFAQQVAVAASSNVGQTLVGTPFSISPGAAPAPFVISTPAVNRRPPSPLNTNTNSNQFTTPILITPLGGTGNSRPSVEQIRTPNPSTRTPTSQIRTPSPTIQTPFAPLRNPTATIQTPFAPLRNPTPSIQTPFAPLRNPTPTSQTPSVSLRNPTATSQAPFAPLRNPTPTSQTPFAPIRNPTPSFIPFTAASTSTGNSGNRTPAENGTQLSQIPTTTTTTTTALPVLTSTVTTVFNGSQGFGPDGKGNNQDNDGSGRFGNPSTVGFAAPGKPSPNSNGLSGTTAFIENSSPGPNSVSPDNRRPGGFTNNPGAGTPSNSFGGNPASGVTPTGQLGGRVTSANPGSGNRNTDGNKFGNDFGPIKFPSGTGSVTPSGGQGTSSFPQHQPQTTGSLRHPTEISNGGGPNGEQPSSFYTEGSSSSIYPEGNHLSTGGPGSQPSSSNNVGETLEQEVEGSSSAIFPGRKTNSPSGNKLSPSKNNGNGGSSNSNGPSGSSRPATSQTPVYDGLSQTTDKRPTENPTRGNNNLQPIRNGNSRDQQNGLNNPSGSGPGSGGITNGPGAFTNKPQGSGSNGQFSVEKTPDFTSGPNLPSPSSSDGLRETNRNNSPFISESADSCPQVCNSCNSNNRQSSPEEIDYSQIPGAVVSNVPVIFYPDCSANAFSRPAIVPFCPSKQQASCSNQQPLTMKFPSVSNFNGNPSGPSARNAFAATVPSRTSRRVIRKTRHSQTDNI